MEEKLDKIKVWANNYNNQRGMGFLGWLALAFVVLKLTGYISWSWWYVLAPIWAPILVVFGLIALVLGALLICTWVTGKQLKKTTIEESYTIILSKEGNKEETDISTDPKSTENSAKKKRSSRKSKTKENGGEGITAEKPGGTQGAETTDK